MDKMMTFAGFPEGKNPYVSVPEIFFTHVLPTIEDSTELKVTMHLFWLLARKRNQPRCISDQELFNDRLLLRSLRRPGDPRPAEERLRQGLALAVARGTLLRVYLYVQGSEGATPVAWYFFNSPRNRKLIAEIEGGQVVPAHLLLEKPAQQEHVSHGANGKGEREEERPRKLFPVPGAREQGDEKTPVRQEREGSVPPDVYARSGGDEKVRALHVEVERPNIFVLYEQNIGLLTPLIAEELKDAANQYPTEWIEAAFREAMYHNKRKWSYIRAILRRWETEGRQQWNV